MTAANSLPVDRVLLLGAHGFLARHLMQRLRAELPQVRIAGVGRRREPAPALDTYALMDFDAPPAARALREFVAAERPQWIFQLIGAPCRTAAESVATNVMPAAHLLDAVGAAAPDASVVVIGSAAEYGKPLRPDEPITETHPCSPENLYGATKLAQTHLALDAARRGICVAVARPFNLVGPGLSPAFFPGAIAQRARDAIARGETSIEVGNLETRRDFIAVEDTAAALVTIARARAAGEIFNVCGGEPVRIRTLLEAMLARLPRPLEVRINPALVRSTDVPSIFGSPGKLRERFGWQPRVALPESLSAMIDHAFGVTA